MIYSIIGCQLLFFCCDGFFFLRNMHRMMLKRPLVFVALIGLFFILQELYYVAQFIRIVFFNTRPIFHGKQNHSIPCIIHQTWKTNDTSTYTKEPSSKGWKEKYPQCEYHLWTDLDILELIKSKHPWLLPTFKSFPY